MATINGKPVDTTLYPTVTKGFSYDEVTVPPKYETEILGTQTTRKRVRYRKGQKVACKTWKDFKDLEALANQYGGEVLFI